MASVPPEVRERIRLAFAELLRRKEKPTIRGLRAEALCDQNAVSVVKRAHDARKMPPLIQPWDVPTESEARSAEPEPGESLDLAAQIQTADGYDDLLSAGRSLSLAVLTGKVDPDVAGALTKLLAEMRQSVRGRASEPPESVDVVLPCTDESRPLVEAFESIIDDARRGRVLAFALREAEQDALEHPNVNTGGSAGGS